MDNEVEFQNTTVATKHSIDSGINVTIDKSLIVLDVSVPLAALAAIIVRSQGHFVFRRDPYIWTSPGESHANRVPQLQSYSAFVQVSGETCRVRDVFNAWVGLALVQFKTKRQTIGFSPGRGAIRKQHQQN